MYICDSLQGGANNSTAMWAFLKEHFTVIIFIELLSNLNLNTQLQ